MLDREKSRMMKEKIRREEEKKKREDFEKISNLQQDTGSSLPLEVHNWEIKKVGEAPTQEGGDDCGVFVLKYMEALASTKALPPLLRGCVNCFEIKGDEDDGISKDDRSYSAVLVEADNCSALTRMLAELSSLGKHCEDEHRAFGASRQREMSSGKPRTMKKKPAENLGAWKNELRPKQMAPGLKFSDEKFSGKEGRRRDPRYL
ncbi:hypothetical protein KSP40_PGU006380 [Platanthera guangdongensis]|uniref:Ubiquitin-like protease family profile domain-containing protein n=1 Tax=Platanthera guangdongensis TaxID=2320717 RepID=A0ABR2M0V0_9ASPA